MFRVAGAIFEDIFTIYSMLQQLRKKLRGYSFNFLFFGAEGILNHVIRECTEERGKIWPGDQKTKKIRF